MYNFHKSKYLIGFSSGEFIGGEVDLRINIYRGQVTTKTYNGIDSTDKVPDNEQEQLIYKHVLENGFITTATVIDLLEVKQRRARAILLNMVESGWLKKEGAARSTIYVRNTEER